MKKNNIRKTAGLILFTILVSVLSSCDPRYNGDIKVFNESDSTLTVITYKYGSTDSLINVIKPDSIETIDIFGGFGDQSFFDCCPCEFQTIKIKTTGGDIKKDPSNNDNWIIPNKSKKKRSGSENLKCELHITQSDL